MGNGCEDGAFEGRCVTMMKRCRLWITLAKNGNGTVMGQNHDFYCNFKSHGKSPQHYNLLSRENLDFYNFRVKRDFRQ